MIEAPSIEGITRDTRAGGLKAATPENSAGVGARCEKVSEDETCSAEWQAVSTEMLNFPMGWESEVGIDPFKPNRFDRAGRGSGDISMKLGAQAPGVRLV